MKTLMVVLTVLLMAPFVWQARADDYNLEDPRWVFWWHDPPRWHYENDSGSTGGTYFEQYLYYIQLELVFSENTLTEGNVIHMWVDSEFWDGQYSWWVYNYFDIPPNVNQLTVQLPIDQPSVFAEEHFLIEMNTIPEGGGYVVIDEANSWFDRFYHQDEVESMSVGRIKFLEK